MAIDKGLYSAPEGMDDSTEEMDGIAADLEIEIVNPDAVYVEDADGSIEISLVSGEGLMDPMMEFGANLAEYMDEGALRELAGDLTGLVGADIESRKEWADTFVEGLDVLGLKYEQRTEPWDGACGVYSTVLTEAAIRFQAETMSETFPAMGPVKTKIIGDVTKEKEDAAERVRADMNYELTERMVEYRPEHERMLYSLGLAGSAFKKVYFDPTIGRQMSVYLPAEDVIVPYGTAHLNTAERVTHIMRKTKNEMIKLQNSGFYRDIELGDPVSFHTDIEKKKAEEDGFSLTDDNRYALYEIHVDLALEEYTDELSEEDMGVARPYVVTIDCGTNEVLGIRRNWEKEDPLMLKRQHFVHYVYVPGFGFYGLGLIHIIGGYARAGTSLMRQLVDAGTLSNLPGGLKTRGLRIKGDNSPIPPGEWKDVDVPSGTIRDNIMALPYKEPSQTLLMLLDRITDEGRRLGAIADINVSDMSANAPVGTTLALLERTLKPMAAVQARVHYAMKQEFKLLKAIMAENAPENYTYQPDRGESSAKRDDYSAVDVIPVSDPNSSTMAQRVVQYQAVLQMSQSAPQIYDLPYLHRQMVEVLGVKNADKIVPVQGEMVPVDPISENMNALNGKPVQAFIYQDHDAHIATHVSFLENPMIAQGIGQNPMANQIVGALQAHIAEHLGFKYRLEIEQKLGVTMPPPNEPLNEDIEVQLSRLVADASAQLSQQKQQEAAAQQSAQQAQDPLIQMQQAELQLKTQAQQMKAQKEQAEIALKGQEQQRKVQKDQADLALQAQKLQLEREKLQIETQLDSRELNSDEAVERAKLRLEEIKLLQGRI